MKPITPEYGYSTRKMILKGKNLSFPVLWKQLNNKWVEMGTYSEVPKEVMKEFYAVEKKLKEL